MFKKVFAMETYALLARGNYVILASIAHNRTESDIFEILRGLHDDLKVDEHGSFIFSIV